MTSERCSSTRRGKRITSYCLPREIPDRQSAAGALASWFVTKGADAVHVVEMGLDRATDRQVWDQAIAESRIVVSKDEDFFHLANRPSDRGRLLWIRIGNCRSTALFALFDARWSAIEEAFGSGQRIVELR